jgi:hypothetical protein
MPIGFHNKPISASTVLTPAGDAVAVATGFNGDVVIVMEVLDGPPVDDRHAFEDVAECSLRSESGVLLLTSPTYGIGDGEPVTVPAGWLRLRVSSPWESFGDGAHEVVDQDDPPRMRLQCWPAPPADPVLIKGWDDRQARPVG